MPLTTSPPLIPGPNWSPLPPRLTWFSKPSTYDDPYDDLDFKKTGSPVWRVRTRSSRERLWDTTNPASEIGLDQLTRSTATFEQAMADRVANAKRREQIDLRIEVIKDEMEKAKDVIYITDLAEERNSLIMEKNILESNDEALKATAELYLKDLHQHRDSMGEFYIDGPHTTENKAALSTVAGMAAVGYIMYYLLVPRGPARMPYRSLFSESAVSGAFKNA